MAHLGEGIRKEHLAMEVNALVCSAADGTRSSAESIARQIVPHVVHKPRKMCHKKETHDQDPIGFEAGTIYKPIGIADSPSEFVDEFRKRVKDRFPKAMLGRVIADKQQSQEVLDILTENGCRTADTIKAWISWFVGDLEEKRAESYYVTVACLKKTWEKFKNLRPNPENQVSKTAAKSSDMSDIIGKQLHIIFSSRPINDGIRTSCELYGIIITADYMRRGLSLLCEDIVKKMTDVLEVCQTEPMIAGLIFDTTCQYEVGPAALKVRMMNDWDRRFSKIWKAAGRLGKTFANNEYKKYVAAYFASTPPRIEVVRKDGDNVH